MPTSEDGRIPDVVLNSLGVTGRLNPSQLYEHELNYIADEIIRLGNLETLQGQKDLITNVMLFLEILNPEQHQFLFKNLFKGKKIEVNKDVKEFLSDIKKDGLSIHQPPFFKNCSPDILLKLYKTFDIKKTKFKGIHEELIFGTMYFIKLRHEPSSKFSARSAGQVSILDVPFKSNERYKKGTAMNNDGPVRFGEQELCNMMLLSNVEEGSTGIIEFLRHYSSHNLERRGMILKLLRNDINKIQRFTTEDYNGAETPTNAAQVIRSYFAGMGITLTKEELVAVEQVEEAV